MKKLLSILLILLTINLTAQAEKNYIYNLPKKSLIRKKCIKCSASWLSRLKNKKKMRACRTINNFLKQYDNPTDIFIKEHFPLAISAFIYEVKDSVEALLTKEERKFTLQELDFLAQTAVETLHKAMPTANLCS